MRPAANPALRGMIAQLLETLREELRQNRRLVRLVRRKKVSLLRDAYNELDSILRAEREAVMDAATLERDRIQLFAQLGQVLGHPEPTRLRIADLAPHAEPGQREELLEIREELRDLAAELEDLASVEPLFTRGSQDNVRLFVSPSRWKRGGMGDSARDGGKAEGTPASKKPPL